MSADRVADLEALLARGPETAVLRFSLGGAHLQRNHPVLAIPHLQRAVELDPGYSAAWKLLGQAQAGSGRFEEAIATYERGIAAAGARGDVQAGKEMSVFLKRLRLRHYQG